MTQLVNRENRAGLWSGDGRLLVGETKKFLQSWQPILLGQAPWADEQIRELRSQGRDLEEQARRVSLGGLAHHLATCEQCLAAAEVDRRKLGQCLRNVSEVTWQLWQELRPAAGSLVRDGIGQISAARLTIDPPALLAPPSIEMFAAAPAAVESLEALHEVDGAPARDAEPGAALIRSDAPAQQSAPQPARDGTPESRLTGDQIERRLRQMRRERGTSFPSLADAFHIEGSAADGAEEVVQWRGSRRPGLPWWSAPLVVAAIGVVVVVALSLAHQRPAQLDAPVGTAVSQASSSLEAAALPKAADEGKELERLVAQVHRHGGLESPELADLIDQEAALLEQQAQQPCAPGSSPCAPAAALHELLTVRTLSQSASSKHEVGAPFAGLNLPAIGFRDDAAARDLVKSLVENPVSREAFQLLLFQCGAYQELFEQMLGRYGLPLDLMALAMVDSGCVPDLESPVGARGLWQFTPATARAYHLRVKAGALDERLNPTKSTDAAVRLLADLYRKTGSWELAIASYQMGPFALSARVCQAGGEAGLWALADAGRLRDETVGYVRKVQTFALILSNLARFHFEAGPRRALQPTGELEVLPGTRLGLVARATSTSTTKIKELNPDLIGDRVPELEGERFVLRVPKDGVFGARDVLAQLITNADNADECVPHTFDWGRHRFTNAMASRCQRNAQAAR